MKLKIDLERVVSVVAFVFLSLAFGGAYVMNGDPLSIIPYSRTVLLIVHGLCALATFVTIIRPSAIMQIAILFVESVITIETNYDVLGIMFFYCALIIILMRGLFKKHIKTPVTVLFILHIISIFLSYTHGWAKTLISLGCSAFFFTFYMWIYSILKSRLSCVIPSTVTNNKSLGGKLPGQAIHLSDYNLSERQISLVMDYFHNNMSYKDLSDKYNISVSLVKKEFSDVFKIFEVNKLDELHILLLQYVVER